MRILDLSYLLQVLCDFPHVMWMGVGSGEWDCTECIGLATWQDDEYRTEDVLPTMRTISCLVIRH